MPQPDNTTCGPTCLHAVYGYFNRNLDLDQLIAQIPAWEGGGTIAVNLGIHALKQGYDAQIFTYNLHVFDPTWFPSESVHLQERLRAQSRHKRVPKLQWASEAYVEFLKRGGKLGYEDLTAGLLRRFLKQRLPILTGLSATYLYRCARETDDSEPDDIQGSPAGHFVVLCGYNKRTRNVMVADPLLPNPVSNSQFYEVNIDRLVCSILLGIVTYDANFLVISPKEKPKKKLGKKAKKKASTVKPVRKTALRRKAA